MRDPNRIKHFADTLAEQWQRVPDWRFGQFMINFLGSLDRDPWFYEDNEMEQKLKDYVNNLFSSK